MSESTRDSVLRALLADCERGIRVELPLSYMRRAGLSVSNLQDFCVWNDLKFTTRKGALTVAKL